jgi:GGDEF domain-containing protein
MRTTLTLDDDLIQRLKQVAHRDGKPFKVVLNETLRAGFGIRDKPAHRTGKTVLRTFRSRLKTGIDETKLNQLVDQLEVESFLAETLKPARRA